MNDEDSNDERLGCGPLRRLGIRHSDFVIPVSTTWQLK